MTSDVLAVYNARLNRAAMPAMLANVLEEVIGEEKLSRKGWLDLAAQITERLDVWPREMADPAQDDLEKRATAAADAWLRANPIREPGKPYMNLLLAEIYRSGWRAALRGRAPGGEPPPPLERAIAIAAKAHADQLDKGGEPYILHALRVMLAVPLGDAQVAAVLHDVVEDTEVSAADLTDAGFNRDVMQALYALTHFDYDPYVNYIERCAGNEIARVVKVADLRDNLIRSRIPHPTEKDHARWAKYERALSVLGEPPAEDGPPEVLLAMAAKLRAWAFNDAADLVEAEAVVRRVPPGGDTPPGGEQ